MESKGIKILICTTILTGVFVTPVLAQVMTSTNFKMQQDSINFGGGYATSENFKMEDTVGEVATGYSENDNFVLHAGYQQIDCDDKFLSLTTPGNVVLFPAIPGLTGGAATNISYTHVMTNNNIGYTLQINASTTPAMQHNATNTYYFNDYSINGGVPSLVWNIDQGTSAFGFTPEGADVIKKYRDNGINCNSEDGNSNLEKCWGPLSQNLETIAQTALSNYPEGSTTTIRFKAENGNQHLQVAGTYQAQITITAFMN